MTGPRQHRLPVPTARQVARNDSLSKDVLINDFSLDGSPLEIQRWDDVAGAYVDAVDGDVLGKTVDGHYVVTLNADLKTLKFTPDPATALDNLDADAEYSTTFEYVVKNGTGKHQHRDRNAEHHWRERCS
jgi:hypothetical protein